MNAEILPLSGKYYGTQIALARHGGKREMVVEIWLPGKPSNRELDLHNNQPQDEEFEKDSWPNDGHYESQLAYDLALAVKEFIEKTDEGNYF